MKTKTIYWILTGLFAAFMLMSAIPDILVVNDAIKMVTDLLGYPKYIIPFLGVAKLLGSIAILIPSFVQIKEWAYAGFFFDLTGAFYSSVSVEGFQVGQLFFIVILGVLFYSRYLNQKLKPQTA